MQIIELKQDQKEQWDEYISKHPESTPYHFYAWGLSIKNAYKHEMFYLAAMEEQAIVGALPLVLVAPPIGNPILCSLPFCDVGGPLADSESIKEELMQRAKALAKSLGCTKLEIRSSRDIAEEEIAQEAICKVRMILPLPESSDILMAGFKAKLRSQIRKSEKNGLTYELGNSEDFIEAFYKVFALNMARLGSPVHHINLFKRLAEKYDEKLIVSLIKLEDQVVGVGIVLMNDNGCVIPWASTDFNFNKLAPNMLLYWSLLAHATEKNCDYFDFGRSTVGEGTYKFKQQWGAKPLELDWQVFEDGNAQPEQKNAANVGKARQLVENIWKKLPIPMTVLLGPTVRKYITL